MKGLFDRVSRKPRRLSRALVLLAVALSVALTLAWPARGGAFRGCGDNITFYGSASNIPSIDGCDYAETKAGNAVMGSVRSQAAAYVCPATCPTLVQVIAPYVTSYGCSFSNGKWYGYATAQGTYVCQ